MGNMEITDKEKLQRLLEHIEDHANIEEILIHYLYDYNDEFSATRIKDLVDSINQRFLYPKIDELTHTKSVAKERATYIKTYLEGKMWKDEESARKNLQPQINNAQAIIDICK